MPGMCAHVQRRPHTASPQLALDPARRLGLSLRPNRAVESLARRATGSGQLFANPVVVDKRPGPEPNCSPTLAAATASNLLGSGGIRDRRSFDPRGTTSQPLGTVSCMPVLSVAESGARLRGGNPSLTMLRPVARTGEQTQEAGREGVRRAKRWLEASCRAEVKWDNPKFGQKLQFDKADGSNSFSFDFAGTLMGGDLEGEEFYAEVKKYINAADQATHYSAFLAQCYRAYDESPHRCDHFMWITWSPFNVTKWDTLMTPSEVKDAVTKHPDIALGDAEADDAACAEVAKRLWLIVLSDKQEELVIDPEHRLEVVAFLQRRRQGAAV
jgi:hypothetical protein